MKRGKNPGLTAKGVGVLALACLALAFTSNQAQAGTSIANPFGMKFPFQTWTDQAQAPTPSAPVTVLYATCPGSYYAVACSNYDSAAGRGNIWISPLWFSNNTYPETLRKVFFHELAHVYAGRMFTEADRKLVTAALGFPTSRGWMQTDPATDKYGYGISPSEWFAEAGAACYMGYLGKDVAYGYSRTWAQTGPVCELMRGAARRPAVTSINNSRQSFTVAVKPGQAFESPQRFLAGSIKVSTSVAGKAFNWASVCPADLNYKGVKLKINSCANKVSIWSFGSAGGTVTYSGIVTGNSTVTLSQPYKLSKAGAAKIRASRSSRQF